MPEQRRLLELDGLRGIAALMVCIYHFNLFVYGATGVDLFFIISGFVIYMSLTHTKTVEAFWVARVIRLYPAYWASIIIAVVSFALLAHQHIEHDANFIIGNVTMLQPVFRSQNLVVAYWTLYIELNFYVLISLIWSIKQFKNIELVVFMIMLAMACFIVTYQLLNNSSPSYTRLFIVFRSLFPLISHFQLFAAGILFYMIYTKGASYFRLLLLLFSYVLVADTHRTGGFVFYFLSLSEHMVCCLIYYILFFW